MDREMASTAPISQPSQYMSATTTQITPVGTTETQNYTHTHTHTHTHTILSKQVTSKPEYATSSLTQNGYEYRQQQQRMCSKHRHSCHTDGQRQQQTPEGTLHTYKQTREQYIIRFLHAAAVTDSC